MVAHPVVAPCRGADLAGTLAVVRNSAGAGNIVYRLRLTNRTDGSCFVTGIPQLRLLGKAGKPLPTHPLAVHPNQLTSVLVVLGRGKSATLTARFSPDVPGPGEPVSGRRCEPFAYRLRVTVGGGAVVVPIRPPTPVCEHGQLQVTAFTAG